MVTDTLLVAVDQAVTAGSCLGRQPVLYIW